MFLPSKFMAMVALGFLELDSGYVLLVSITWDGVLLWVYVVPVDGAGPEGAADGGGYRKRSTL